MCEENLAEILDDISDEEFTTFKWYLKKETWKGMEPIKTKKLQTAERLEVVDLMVQKYNLSEAMMIMVNLFKKINRNDLVKKLTDLLPQTAAEATSSSSSVDSVELLTSVRTKLVAKISKGVLQQLLDRMLENKILNDSEIDLGQQNQGDKIREVVDMVRKKGSKASSAFIAALCELDPCLAEDLKLN
ncbi:uncharacterized protein FYW61_016252 [Anableps anableps]